MAGFTHFDKEGKARMVDVSDKAETERSATAKGSVLMQPAPLALVKEGAVKKGDVLARLGDIFLFLGIVTWIFKTGYRLKS